MASRSGRAMHRAMVATVLASIAGWADAQTITATPGGTIRTSLGRGIALNKESSIERTWITVHDPSMLVEFKAPAGVKTTYTLRGDYGEYDYNVAVQLTARQPISAVEIRFLLFDIWGKNTKSLVMTQVMDMMTGTTKEFNAKWQIPSETEAAQYYASIAYVSRVRTQDGRVLGSNGEFVLEQARKFSAQFKEVDLEPGKPPD